MIDVEKQKKEQLLIEKRKKLAEKYNFWLKKNRVRLAVASALYLVAIIINYFFIKNTKINLAASLLIFS